MDAACCSISVSPEDD